MAIFNLFVVAEKITRNVSKRVLDDVKEWTGLSWNDMWREPENCVAWSNNYQVLGMW